MQIAALAFVLSGAFVFTWLVRQVVDRYRHAAIAKKLGCEPPRWGIYHEPSGLIGLIEAVRAVSDKIFPDFLNERFEDLRRKRGSHMGTVQLKTFPFRTTLFTTDPQNIQAILALKFKDFELGPNRTDNFKPLLGHGIFASNGKTWEHSRAMLRPSFTRSQITDLDLEERHVQSLFSVLNPRIGPDGWSEFVDLQPLFFNLTLDSATEFLFGESVDSQLSDQDNGFATAFDAAQTTLSVGAKMGGNLFWLVHTPKFRRNVKLVHDFVDRFVAKTLSSKEKTSQDDRYVFLRALAEQTSDPDELRSELLNILLAGRDTTASTLGWFFYTMCLTQYQKLYHKLRAVILEDFGTYNNPREITFERLKGCQYLQYCVNEIIRLYPAVPVNVRTAAVDTTLPIGGGPDGQSPVYVRKGQDVGYAVYVLHRREDIWGPDSKVFRPERWADARPGWGYLPFNGGPRICLGQQFALTELSYVIVRMMQRIDNLDGSRAGPVRHALSLTNAPDKAYMRLHFAQ
ncbi:hypothetical protein CDD82_443 [Ophiocordyceps australis]|uniref:Cytochrome P450 n=1 Tax=Ophiocordyceps australis TaxID=1399860 RepID=A0A2C5ZVJ7_9HYPO|nr:hypothetical protein CDD82_443 [Ophiocordyceps australis]